ncbi:hypothetical protein DE146DRAFT_735131 [Phaeosphaeria sp. MPI-PUGE-AT-0046c]|nr:hypothetical protein DE146DRAFT_735131 [Phaeosphaeria sp. MPI-PUGE-AT-0046c]
MVAITGVNVGYEYRSCYQHESTQDGLVTAFANADYQGCYAGTDANGLRLMNEKSINTLNPNSHQACMDWCTNAAGGPYDYFGIEFGVNCRCANQYAFTPTTSGATCDKVATGTTNEAGGGANALTVYKRKASSVSIG